MEKENIGVLNLQPFLQSQPDLFHMVKRLFVLYNILVNNDIRYYYLVSLISSDKVYDVKTGKRAMDELLFIKDNLKYLVLEENIKEEVMKYVRKGIRIVKRDIKDFEIRENNKEKETTDNGIDNK